MNKDIFKELFTTKKFVAHYAIFEHMHITHNIAPLNNIHCSYVASKLLHQAITYHNNSRNSLADLVKSYFDTDISKTTQTSDWGKEELDYQQVEYASLDILCLEAVWLKLKDDLRKHNLINSYLINVQSIPVLSQMQLSGIKLNKEEHFKSLQEWSTKLWEAKQKIINATGISDVTGHQVSHWLSKNLPKDILQLWTKTETGKLKTDWDTFEAFKAVECIKGLPFLEYQEYDKLTSSFGLKLQQAINPVSHRIHSSFNILGTMTSRLTSTNPNCFTGDTEILTTNGWVRFDELKEFTGKVAQWDKGDISFTDWKYVEKEVDEDLVHYTNKHVDLLCTKDHRLLIQNRKNEEYKDVLADKLPEDYKVLHTGNYQPEYKKELYSDDFLRILVMVQADGYVHAGGIDIAFSKQRKIDRFKLLMSKEQIQYSTHKPREYSNKLNNTLHKYRLLKGDKVSEIIKLLGKNKILPSFLLHLNSLQRKVVFDEIFYWDGLYTRKNNYSSKLKANCDILQLLGCFLGHRVKIREYSCNKVKNKNHTVSYQLDITQNQDYSLTTNIKKQHVPYKGKVFCVSVPSSYILVRRNGKTLVTGQCQQIPRDIGIRRLFEAEEGNKLIVSDFSQIEVRVAAELSKDKNMIEIYNKGLDVYIQTASLVLGKPYDTIKKDTEAGKSEDRSVFKVVVLASMYGMGGEKLRNQLKNALGLNLTIEQTKGYIDGLKKTFPEYFKFQRKQTEFGEKYLLALTKSGLQLNN
jgi:DNA polymerase I-like protein with 3'-5' exonuclease and polymerase domains